MSCSFYFRWLVRLLMMAKLIYAFSASIGCVDVDLISKKTISKSQIREIRSRNLCGVVGITDDDSTSCNCSDDVVIPFQDGESLAAVTGESGTGKSLLVARVVELLTGGKAPTTFLASQSQQESASATVQMELSLRPPFLAAACSAFDRLGLDPSSLVDPDEDEHTGTLRLSRTLVRQPTNTGKYRLKSECQVNGQSVTLKTLTSLASPLLVVVDATTAAAALCSSLNRVAILDTAVDLQSLVRASQTKRAYRKSRRERERLENKLASRTLPPSFSPSKDENDVDLLNHWIEELDVFQLRAQKLSQAAAVAGDDPGTSEVERIGQKLLSTGWRDNAATEGQLFSSSLYALLSDLRDELILLDNHILSVRNSVDTLSLLSSPNSAATALERARELLFDATATLEREESNLSSAAERSHDLLNDVETALKACTRFIEGSDGILRLLEISRARCPLSVESIDEILLDWNSLARKHGIPAASLPSCHAALADERDGNVDELSLLREAKTQEKKALIEFEAACSLLSKERQQVAFSLSEAVTQRLPSLGMDSSFQVDLHTNIRKCSDSSAFASTTNRGLDDADFLMIHSGPGLDSQRRGGDVNVVSSSGEKARILLAIECALPGSIGKTCTGITALQEDLWNGLPPIAIVYDEIDAHVGGRAAVSLANMLVDQSRNSQVIAITHSPSVAANAQAHVVIQKAKPEETYAEGVVPVRATVSHGADRIELARMASGDLVTKEAAVFVDALIREAEVFADGTRKGNGD